MCSDIIKAVVQTLNQIEVKGKHNLDMLLGCINALEKTVIEMEKELVKEVSNGG